MIGYTDIILDYIPGTLYFVLVLHLCRHNGTTKTRTSSSHQVTSLECKYGRYIDDKYKGKRKYQEQVCVVLKTKTYLLCRTPWMLRVTGRQVLGLLNVWPLYLNTHQSLSMPGLSNINENVIKHRNTTKHNLNGYSHISTVNETSLDKEKTQL